MQHTQGDAAQNKADKAHVDDLERAADNVGVLAVEHAAVERLVLHWRQASSRHRRLRQPSSDGPSQFPTTHAP